MAVIAQFRRDACLQFLLANRVFPGMSEYTQVSSLPEDWYFYFSDDDSLFYFNSENELQYVFLPGGCEGWVLII